MYKYIVFDMDGTLIDTEKVIITSLQKVVEEELNTKVEYDDLLFALGIPSAVVLKKLGINDFTKANNIWKKYKKQKMDQVRVHQGIQDMLGKLTLWGINMGIVTSESRKELNSIFSFLGLSGYFDKIVCEEDTVLHKPNPEPLLKFLELSGTENSSILYIGDTKYDMQCANRAGVDFGLALWGAKSPQEIDSKYKFESPEKILRLYSD